jgi:hypothetical protein
LSETFQRLDQIKEINPELLTDIGYFGNAGNYFQYETQIKSANILNSPIDITPAKIPLETGCSYLIKLNVKYLLIDENGLIVKEAFGERGLCDLYHFTETTYTAGKYLLVRNDE